jgi:RNA polymerase sigma-70 factor (ECF subfamily)
MNFLSTKPCDTEYILIPVTESKPELNHERAFHSELSNDAARVAAAKNGNRSAFGTLYERYARMVHGILLGRVPFPEVDDLVHEVFLIALRELHTLRNDDAFGGWLARITRNCAHDYFRRSPFRKEVALPENIVGPGAASAEAEAHVALNAIRALPEAYRETLMFRLVEGMTGPEIAARTGLTSASVRVNLHRGMKLLREKLSGKT